MATTPPPSTLRIPPTPRHGAGYDQYEPYSTRHSARLASQRASKDSRTTPEPSFPASHSRAAPPKSAREQRDPEFEALSPPGSIHNSPRKKQSGRSRGFVATHSLGNTAGLDSADPFSTTEPSHTQQPSLSALRTTMTDGMLPTPAKTPKKKAVGDAGSTARVLFPPSSLSGRTKKPKKHLGFSLDSFSDDPSQNQSSIQIYTDSRDRIPEVDESESNPFYKKTTEVEPPVPAAPRVSRRRKVGESKRDKEVDDAVKRDDGMFYVFRGKKTFRKFTEDTHDDAEDDDDDLGLLAARPDLIDSSVTSSIRPLTRSSIKPRVLFPSASDRRHQSQHLSDVDEEAATDIEEHLLPKDAEDSEVEPAPETDMLQRPVTPPLKSEFATPSSPGATIRSLRPRAKRDAAEHESTPIASETKKKRASPFDGWLRKKPVPAVAGSSKAKKRDAEAIGSPGGPATKKTRASRAAASS
ncbi:hypothetical protein ASPWEDRAFT_25013 [Aspergillus wentii DTO 134E9]|uniref:Uncharacterized protein n=1 Tax=Aspergillus wentii DTO 134E9 TaxID=1073089 RepID=A0A1L9RW49_ASPWE|nr:uncharacterized protein ASPWEDRAFT_25013 [Aspergillus wentii DTO 134E9]KAI9929144.1 hypothetical protein MW887_001548 [Aspergillus wentii]OJJ39159.1 hypothetical protein ASPWEDRAFT_25013 [Aspergillus wentii DTO 134E9]